MQHQQNRARCKSAQRRVFWFRAHLYTKFTKWLYRLLFVPPVMCAVYVCNTGPCLPEPAFVVYGSRSCSKATGDFVHVDDICFRGLVFDQWSTYIRCRPGGCITARGRLPSLSCRLLLLRVYGYETDSHGTCRVPFELRSAGDPCDSLWVGSTRPQTTMGC